MLIFIENLKIKVLFNLKLTESLENYMCQRISAFYEVLNEQ